MMLRYTFNEAAAADRIEQAVNSALDAKVRTADIYSEGMIKVSTSEMGDAVVNALKGA
jgi:3-isopropylmalate dehydrogenase